MNGLNTFVEAWEKTGKIEDILEAGLVLPSPDEAQSFLSGLPPEEQARIRKSLEQAMAAFAGYTEELEKEALSLKSQIDQNIQASNACLSYNNTPKKERR